MQHVVVAAEAHTMLPAARGQAALVQTPYAVVREPGAAPAALNALRVGRDHDLVGLHGAVGVVVGFDGQAAEAVVVEPLASVVHDGLDEDRTGRALWLYSCVVWLTVLSKPLQGETVRFIAGPSNSNGLLGPGCLGGLLSLLCPGLLRLSDLVRVHRAHSSLEASKVTERSLAGRIRVRKLAACSLVTANPSQKLNILRDSSVRPPWVSFSRAGGQFMRIRTQESSPA